MGDPDIDALSDSINELRQRGDSLGALKMFLEDSSPDPFRKYHALRQHFLGGSSEAGMLPCLLLDAAKFGDPRVVSELIEKLRQTEHGIDDRLAEWFGTDRLHWMLNARLTVLAALVGSKKPDEIQELLLTAVQLYAKASPPAPPIKTTEPPPTYEPAFFKTLSNGFAEPLRAVRSRWSAKQGQGAASDWDDPALLLVGDTLAYHLNMGQLPSVGETVETWVLLTSPLVVERGSNKQSYPDGLLAKLIIEKVPGGGGLLYPDCRFGGYLPLDADFQQGLRNVMQVIRRRPEWITQLGPTFDFRWRLVPLSPGEGYQLPVQLGEIGGRSAEAAFACAIRAALMNERLDPSVATTACFEEPGAKHERLAPVKGIDSKLLGIRQERNDSLLSLNLRSKLVDRVILCGDAQPEEVRIHEYRIGIEYAPTFDDAYRQLSDHCRLTDQYRTAVLWSTRQWFQKECFGSGDKTDPTGAYRLNDFQLRATNPAADEKSVPFDGERLGQLIRGDVRDALSLDGRPAWRANIVADSGMGKTSLLVYIAHQTASEHGVRIPIRVEQLSTFLSVPKRDSFLDAAVAEVHSLLTDYQQHVSPESKVPTRESLISWLDVATSRAEVVWLLDALDQMSEHQSHLKRFADEFDECAVLLTMRQEALSSSPLRDRGQTLDLQPFTTDTAKAYLGEKYADLFFERLPISDLGEPEDGHVLTIPLLLHLLRQLAIDLNLDPAATQIDHSAFRNRYRIYDLALIHEGGLVDKGCRSLALRKDLDAAKLDNKRRAIKCLREMALRQMRAGHVDTRVTGRLYEDLATHLDSLSNDAEDAFKQINVVTQLPAFDQHPLGGLKWRHRSFLEFFAGCQLAELPLEELKRQIDDHARDDKWSWCLRFAVSKIAVEAPEQVDEIAQCLLEAGAPFLLWTMIDEDGITVAKLLDDLCRWLVHRDRDSWRAWSDPETSPWAGRQEDQRPEMTGHTAAILAKMFAVDEPEPWRRRDSRWLHPAWQLVVENLPGEPSVAVHSVKGLPIAESREIHDTTTPRLLQKIHTRFLGEFEQRVWEAAARNQSTPRKDWFSDDQGVLQLVPDDVLWELGVISYCQLYDTRHWPGQESGYESRRETFNWRLKKHGANYCACPPFGWEHPYLKADGSTRNPRECYVSAESKRTPHTLPENYELQRTPLTNLQFEVFDSSHQRFRRMEWKRGDADNLDDHPVIQVSWFQARILCVWLSGQGTFGHFGLPIDMDWEACCRGGRDGTNENFGIPSQHVSGGRFFSISSFEANFDGNSPYLKEDKGPDRKGTVPVDRFAANGFGLVDMHGQVREWGQNKQGVSEPGAGELFVCSGIRRAVLSGSWAHGARSSFASQRDWGLPDDRDASVGIRVFRTRE